MSEIVYGCHYCVWTSENYNQLVLHMNAHESNSIAEAQTKAEEACDRSWELNWENK